MKYSLPVIICLAYFAAACGKSPKTVREIPPCYSKSEEAGVAVRNAGFEKEVNGLPSDWSTYPEDGYTFARMTDTATDGVASAYIKGAATQNDHRVFPHFSQTAPLSVPVSMDGLSGYLRLHARVRTQSVSGDWGAYISIMFLDASGGTISERVSTESVDGDADWRSLTAIGDIPEGTARVGINLVLNGNGAAWFDSISLSQFQAGSGPYASTGIAEMALADAVVQQKFFGFGVQNDPYLYNPNVNPNITDEDFQVVEARISRLQPKLVRVFFDASWLDKAHDTPEIASLVKTLRLYEGIRSDINLTMQTWGAGGPDYLEKDDYLGFVPKIVGLLDYLIRMEGLTHIHYLTLQNEPNYEFKLSRNEYVEMYRVASDALVQSGLPVELIGGDESNSFDFFQAVIPPLAAMQRVDAFSYHDYGSYNAHTLFIERGREHLQFVNGNGGKKPLFIFEFGVKGGGGDTTFTLGEIAPGVLINDDYGAMLGLAQDALYGMWQGIAGFSYFEAYDMYYTPDPDKKMMTCGLWKYQDEGWQIRPFYYLYGLLTRLTQSGATILEIGFVDCSRTLPAAYVLNPDGTRTVYVINPTPGQVNLHLTDLPNGWRPKRYLLTESVIRDLTGQDALFADYTYPAIKSRQQDDQLPPFSMVAYSDAP